MEKFVKIEGAISKESIALSAKYFGIKFNNIKDYKIYEGTQDGDVVEPYSPYYYNDPVAYSHLMTLHPLIEKVWKKKLLLTYVFCRLYRKGMWLVPHIDREACEYSSTLPITGGPWPIFMDGTPVVMTPGDIATYKGLEVEHWREPLDGPDQVQLHLHYVDANGPHKDRRGDN